MTPTSRVWHFTRSDDLHIHNNLTSFFLLSLEARLQLPLWSCQIDWEVETEAVVYGCGSELVVVFGIFECDSFIVIVHDAVEKEVLGLAAGLAVKLSFRASIVFPEDRSFVRVLLVKIVLIILEVYFWKDAVDIAFYEFDELCDFEYNGILACELELLLMLDCVKQKVKSQFVVQNCRTWQISESMLLKFVLDSTVDPFFSQFFHNRFVLTPLRHQDRHVRIFDLQLILHNCLLLWSWDLHS